EVDLQADRREDVVSADAPLLEERARRRAEVLESAVREPCALQPPAEDAAPVPTRARISVHNNGGTVGNLRPWSRGVSGKYKGRPRDARAVLDVIGPGTRRAGARDSTTSRRRLPRDARGGGEARRADRHGRGAAD